MSITNIEIQQLIENKSIFVNDTVQWQKNNHPARTVEYEKCIRDLNFVVDAYIYVDSGTSNSTVCRPCDIWSKILPSS